MTDPPARRRRWPLGKAGVIVAALVGTASGLGLFAFDYGEGLSYFSTDPTACVTGHVMQPMYDAWQKASHHTAATCVDCHLPAHGVEKYLAKADNGYRHSKAFTFMDFHEPIQITPRNARILQDNCLRCHGELVTPILSTGPHGQGVACVHCHADVGHGP